MEPWNMEGRKEGVKGARYDFVRAAEKEKKTKKKKDLCISKNGRKTSARASEGEAAYFSSDAVAAAADTTLPPRSQWQLGQTDRRDLDRATG